MKHETIKLTKRKEKGKVVSMEKQINLEGKIIEKDETVEEDAPTLSLWKSCLQKAVRRGEVERAMYAALMLLEKGGAWITWKRLSVIADEDVGQPEVITAIDVLYRKFQAMRKSREEKGYSWDEKRCVVLAAKILAEAPKDRRADEFLDLMDTVEKYKARIPNLESILKAYEPPDYAYDGHTKEGRKMGRGFNTVEGLTYWYEVASKCENMTEGYRKWRQWFEPLMIEIVKRIKEKGGD